MLNMTSNIIRHLALKSPNLRGLCHLRANFSNQNFRSMDQRHLYTPQICPINKYSTKSQSTEPANTASGTQFAAETVPGKPPSDDSKLQEPLISTEELEKLQIDVQKFEEQAKLYKDNYQRALAEAENVRTRMSKQVQEARQFGIAGFCKELLSVADTMRLASDNIPEDQLENPNVKNMLEGLKLTESQLLKVLKDHGVTQINPDGEKFDPNFHEALFEQPIPDKEPGTVFIVTKVGYTLHSRVLRPALVGVVKAS